MYIIFLWGIYKFLANVIMCSVKDTPQCQVVVISILKTRVLLKSNSSLQKFLSLGILCNSNNNNNNNKEILLISHCGILPLQINRVLDQEEKILRIAVATRYPFFQILHQAGQLPQIL